MEDRWMVDENESESSPDGPRIKRRELVCLLESDTSPTPPICSATCVCQCVPRLWQNCAIENAGSDRGDRERSSLKVSQQ